MFDYDEFECPNCGHLGVMPDGGYDYECSECGYEGSFIDDEDEETCSFED